MAKLILHLDKTVFLDRYSAFVGCLDDIKVGSFFYFISVLSQARPRTSWVRILINGVAPAVDNSALKVRNTAVLHKKGAIAICRRQYDDIWRNDIARFKTNGSGIGVGVANIADRVDIVANCTNDARVVGVAVLPSPERNGVVGTLEGPFSERAVFGYIECVWV